MQEAIENIIAALNAEGIPATYHSWPLNETPNLPFVCVVFAYSNNFGADNVVWQKINHLQIELYTKIKDLEAEGKVENALSSFFWEKIETYLDDEQCYQIIYEIEV